MKQTKFLNFMEKEGLERENKRLKALVMFMFTLNVLFILALSFLYIKGA